MAWGFDDWIACKNSAINQQILPSDFNKLTDVSQFELKFELMPINENWRPEVNYELMEWMNNEFR